MIRTYFDEMYDAGGQVRPHYREFARWLAETPDELLAQRLSLIHISEPTRPY